MSTTIFSNIALGFSGFNFTAKTPSGISLQVSVVHSGYPFTGSEHAPAKLLGEAPTGRSCLLCYALLVAGKPTNDPSGFYICDDISAFTSYLNTL